MAAEASSVSTSSVPAVYLRACNLVNGIRVASTGQLLPELGGTGSGQSEYPTRSNNSKCGTMITVCVYGNQYYCKILHHFGGSYLKINRQAMLDEWG